jgi:hypothetical protein
MILTQKGVELGLVHGDISIGLFAFKDVPAGTKLEYFTKICYSELYYY